MFRRDMLIIILLSWLVIACGCATLDKVMDTGADIVEKAEEVTKVLGIGGVITTLLGVLGIGIQTVRKWTKDKQLASMVGGVDEIKDTIYEWVKNFKAEKKRLPTFGELRDFINTILRVHANAKGVKEAMDADVHKFRDMLKKG